MVISDVEYSREGRGQRTPFALDSRPAPASPAPPRIRPPYQSRMKVKRTSSIPIYYYSYLINRFTESFMVKIIIIIS